MAKLKHYTSPGYWYFITTSTFNYHPVFEDPDNASIAVNVLYSLRNQQKLYVLSWVIMPEHVHFIIVLRKYSLSKIMQEYKKSTSRLVNISKNTTGRKNWMDGYHDRVIRTDSELRIKINYIHFNPVKRDLAKAPEDYYFSSAYEKWETDLDLCVSGSGTSRTTGCG